MEISDQIQAPANLSPGKNLDTHLIGGWVGPGAGLNGLEKSKISRPAAVNICYRI
jgi:hypothetical protein